jgi:hypothetical protein
LLGKCANACLVLTKSIGVVSIFLEGRIRFTWGVDEVVEIVQVVQVDFVLDQLVVVVEAHQSFVHQQITQAIQKGNTFPITLQMSRKLIPRYPLKLLLNSLLLGETVAQWIILLLVLVLVNSAIVIVSRQSCQ